MRLAGGAMPAEEMAAGLIFGAAGEIALLSDCSMRKMPLLLLAISVRDK